MKLTEEDHSLLRGDHGEVAKEAMEYQLDIAKFHGAEEMVSVSQVTTGLDYAMGGDGSLKSAEDYLARGGRFRCYTKAGLQVVPLYEEPGLDTPPDLISVQRRLHDAFVALGAIVTYSNVFFPMPQFGEQVAWTGNHVTANSFFGARTNFEGPVNTLMAALTGRVPKIGMRITENRRGNALVRVRTTPRGVTDWDALGYAIGKALKEATDVPVLLDMPRMTDKEIRQRFDSNIAVPSSLQMYHIVGGTPEARTLEEALQGSVPDREVVITDDDVDQVYRDWNWPHDEVDLVVLGGNGHHTDLDAFPEIVARFDGRRVAESTRVWLFTAPQYKPIIDAMGYAKTLHRAGVQIIYGTSLTMMSPRHYVENHGLRRVVSNSAKNSRYARHFGMQSSFHTLEECVEAATTGKMRPRTGGGR